MYSLGIKPFGHDTAACLVRDNEIIAASAQERFDRITHSSAFPFDAIKFCLDAASIKINQVDEIAISYNYDEAIIKLFFLRTLLYIPKSLLHIKDFTKILNTKSKVIKKLKIDVGYSGKILFLDHHDCHAASAYYCSPFNKTAIITLDGRGEWATNRIYTAENGHIKRFDQMNYPNSIGMVYENVTSYLGFSRNSDEGKVMGLSSYGKPKYYAAFKKIIKNKGDWKYSLDLSFFNHHLREKALLPEEFIKIFGQARGKNEKINTRHKNIASSLQKITNDLIFRIAKKAKSIRGDNNLCIAGGVGLNAVSNGIIYKKNLFNSIFVQPAAGDDGTALGAALLAISRHIPNYKISKFSPYLGRYAKKEEVTELIKKNNNIIIHKVKYPYVEAAKHIANGKIVGWFQGRSEFGPRALGNRSILGDARNPLMKDIINIKVKFREEFRPFAPAVLFEHASKYFDIKTELPYMTIVVKVINKKHKEIPSVVHVDLTARIQTIKKKDNPLFYKLINEFYRITGIPLIINTSFNLKGEPIVNTPKEAYNCFMKSGIDIMYIGNYEFIKK